MKYIQYAIATIIVSASLQITHTMNNNLVLNEEEANLHFKKHILSSTHNPARQINKIHTEKNIFDALVSMLKYNDAIQNVSRRLFLLPNSRSTLGSLEIHFQPTPAVKSFILQHENLFTFTPKPGKLDLEKHKVSCNNSVLDLMHVSDIPDIRNFATFIQINKESERAQNNFAQHNKAINYFYLNYVRAEKQKKIVPSNFITEIKEIVDKWSQKEQKKRNRGVSSFLNLIDGEDTREERLQLIKLSKNYLQHINLQSILYKSLLEKYTKLTKEQKEYFNQDALFSQNTIDIQKKELETTEKRLKTREEEVRKSYQEDLPKSKPSKVIRSNTNTNNRHRKKKSQKTRRKESKKLKKKTNQSTKYEPAPKESASSKSKKIIITKAPDTKKIRLNKLLALYKERVLKIGKNNSYIILQDKWNTKFTLYNATGTDFDITVMAKVFYHPRVKLWHDDGKKAARENGIKGAKNILDSIRKHRCPKMFLGITKYWANPETFIDKSGKKIQTFSHWCSMTFSSSTQLEGRFCSGQAPIGNNKSAVYHQFFEGSQGKDAFYKKLAQDGSQLTPTFKNTLLFNYKKAVENKVLKI